jgi:two-component system, OmpR family, KDP operon response regulator KdpE
MSGVLIVDDEPQMLRTLSINLRGSGYEVHTATNGAAALATATRQQPDLVLLDLGLPDVEGTEVIQRLREWSTVPIIVLSGRADPLTKTDALDRGADDYVSKPFSMSELHARVRATLRRADPGGTGGQSVHKHRLGHWVIDLAAHTITSPATGGDRADASASSAEQRGPHLTPTEWQLLQVFLTHPGKLIESRELLIQVWGRDHMTNTNYLRFFLSRLRAKLEPVPSRPRYLLTEPGVGYRYQP